MKVSHLAVSILVLTLVAQPNAQTDARTERGDGTKTEPLSMDFDESTIHVSELMKIVLSVDKGSDVEVATQAHHMRLRLEQHLAGGTIDVGIAAGLRCANPSCDDQLRDGHVAQIALAYAEGMHGSKASRARASELLMESARGWIRWIESKGANSQSIAYESTLLLVEDMQTLYFLGATSTTPSDVAAWLTDHDAVQYLGWIAAATMISQTNESEIVSNEEIDEYIKLTEPIWFSATSPTIIVNDQWGKLLSNPSYESIRCLVAFLLQADKSRAAIDRHLLRQIHGNNLRCNNSDVLSFLVEVLSQRGTEAALDK